MRRIANYRSGDRAEALGLVLMQLFCAIAPVPRQEDFGVGDAVATLLRRDGRFLYAEDSFLVQFKSRTERVLKFIGNRLKVLLEQELALFIAQVDLTKAEVSLYSVGAALAHPNIADVQGLVLHLNRVPQEVGTNLRTWLGEPILRWTAAQLADQGFETTAYSVMKKWLEWDRWNRRYRKMGLQRTIRWETNKEPVEAGTHFKWSPDKAKEALGEVVPALQTIGSLAINKPEISIPVLALMSWFREQGVDPDPHAAISPLLVFDLRKVKAREVLEGRPEGTIAVILDFLANEPGRYVITETAGGLAGPWSQLTRGTASPEELRELGYEVDILAESQRVATIRLGAEWLAKRRCELLGEQDGVFLLRKVDPNSTAALAPPEQPQD